MERPITHAISASRVFDGTSVHEEFATVIEGPRIIGIMPAQALPASMPVRHLPTGAWLVPGFIDTQVNGGGDVLFNDDPSPRGIAVIAAAHRRFGTTALLPTLISDSADKMQAARNAVEAVASTNPSIIGLHYEGPFLSPGRLGVHDRAMIRRPQRGDFEML